MKDYKKAPRKVPKEKSMPSLEDYLAGGNINQKLYDTIQMIPKEDKRARVLETLHRRIKTRGALPY